MITVLGSFADMPTDLKAQIDRLEELFMVSTEKLKHISDHFVSELKKGLSKEGGSIVGRIQFNNGHDRLILAAYDSYLVYGLPRWPRKGQLPRVGHGRYKLASL